MAAMHESLEASNTAITQRILTFIERTGFDLIQSNGQRRYGPPPGWVGPPPPRGSEIFIGKLPRDCYEDELVPAFERVGRIYEMRLMMDFSGLNRGYGFVKYVKVEDAHRAVMLMDDYEIRPGNRVGVSKSVDNCRLFVGGINLFKTAEEVQEELAKYVDGIVQIIMYASIMDKSRNRGFVFAEFESHRLAAMARRRLIPGGVTLWGQQIIVDWAEPEPEVDPKIMMKIRKLYVRNLNVSTSEETLRNVVETLTASTNILRIKKIKDYAFLHFKTRGAAEFVLMKMHGMVIHGTIIQVSWARPPMYSKSRIALPNKMSLCLSLPPRLRNQNRTQRVNAPPITTVVPTMPTYYCSRPPITPGLYHSSSASSHISSESSNQNFYHMPAMQQTQPPIMIPAQHNMPQPQYYYPPEEMANRLYVQPPQIEHTIIPMQCGPQITTGNMPLYYQYIERPQQACIN